MIDFSMFFLFINIFNYNLKYKILQNKIIILTNKSEIYFIISKIIYLKRKFNFFKNIKIKKSKHNLILYQKKYIDFYTKNKIIDFLYFSNFSDAFLFSILQELNNKFNYGCVSFYKNGNHLDMNYKTLINGIYCIYTELKKLEKNPNILNLSFKDYRNLGKNIETKLLITNNGVNTYKGLLFLILYLFKFLHKIDNLDDFSNSLKDFSKFLKNDYKIYENNKKLSKTYISNNKLKNEIESFTLKLYNINKFFDIRSEVLSGFTNIKLYNKFIKEYKNLDFLFFYILQNTTDSTTIKRLNFKNFKDLHNYIKKIDINYINILKINKIYNANNLTCGGVCDLFTSSILFFIERIKIKDKKFFKNKIIDFF